MRQMFYLTRRVLALCVGFCLSLHCTLLSAASFALNVNGGAGGGVYEQGSVVHIFADPYEAATDDRSHREVPDPDSPNRTFDRWSGDTQYVDNLYAPDATITMPGANVSVTATYKDTRKWIQGIVVSDFPPNYRGVIFLFHGKGGCAACLWQLAESRRFIDDALGRGFAIVAMDSQERGDEGRWAGTDWSALPDPQNNVDMQRLKRVRQQLIQEGQMSPMVPTYFVGMSNGGIFASQFTSQTQAELGVNGYRNPRKSGGAFLPGPKNATSR